MKFIERHIQLVVLICFASVMSVTAAVLWKKPPPGSAPDSPKHVAIEQSVPAHPKTISQNDGNHPKCAMSDQAEGKGCCPKQQSGEASVTASKKCPHSQTASAAGN